MRLQTKVLLTVGLTVVAISLVLGLAARLMLLRSFTDLEESETRTNARRAAGALNVELSSLSANTKDWAWWDDTYAYIKTRNPAYVRSNLVDMTFRDLRLNARVLTDDRGRVAYSKGFDLRRTKAAPVPASLLHHIKSPGCPLVRHRSLNSHAAGIVLLADGPMLVASWPIATSQGKGPARGNLIMGRYLSPAEITRMAETVYMDVRLRPYHGRGDVVSFPRSAPALSEGPPVVVRPLSHDVVAAYVLLKDVYGRANVLLQIKLPRPVFSQGETSILYFLLALSAVGLVFVVVSVEVFERTVISRVLKLGTEVAGIARSGSLSTRVSESGRDELADLAGQVNVMLAGFEQAQRERDRSHRQIQELTKAMREHLAGHDAGHDAGHEGEAPPDAD